MNMKTLASSANARVAPTRPRRTLPSEPVQRELERRRTRPGNSWETLAVQLGLSSRTLMRVMADGVIAPWLADRLAIALGLHPRLLWPQEWEQSIDDDARRAGGGRR